MLPVSHQGRVFLRKALIGVPSSASPDPNEKDCATILSKAFDSRHERSKLSRSRGWKERLALLFESQSAFSLFPIRNAILVLYRRADYDASHLAATSATLAYS